MATYRELVGKNIKILSSDPSTGMDGEVWYNSTKGTLRGLGAIEAYPFTGSSEIITDITSTGETLKANNLRVLKDGEILKSEACMMISKSSSKNKSLQSLARLLSKN